MELQASLLLLILFNLQSTTVMPATVNNSTDMSSLLAFKAGADASGILEANWTTNTPFCSWIGIGCSSDSQQQTRVVSLNLSSFALQGSISPHLSNLSFLASLDLSNNSLTGVIPDSLGRLPGLVLLHLQSNLLSGPIPSSVFNMSSLVDIRVGSNRLSGPLIAIEIPRRLRSISVENNMLTGEIPPAFSRCSDLQQMNLNSNEFSGSIPSWLGNLSGMTTLELYANYFTGTVPTSLGNLTKLRGLSLSTNQLTGEIPKELGNLANLKGLQLNNNSFTGSIPLSLLNCSMMVDMGISYNNLAGSVPASLGISMPRLETLFMGNNKLTGDLDFLVSLTNCRSLNQVEVYYNQLEGTIPDAVGNFSTNLQYFHLSANNITGSIPVVIGNLSSLMSLGLSYNQLTGTIPTSLSRLQNLQYMSLDANRLTGTVPSDIGQLTRLVQLSFSGNEISGPVPDSMGNISGLQFFGAAENKLSSTIPLSFWSLSGLITLNVYRNRFEGTLPTEIANLKTIDYIDLWSNRLSGKIPSAVGDLQTITYLELSNNSFTGEIPQQLGNLISVSHLNLSHNFLSGPIPKSFENLRYIGSLDLSFNNLEGQVPEGKVFSNITYLEGNSELCGGAPQLEFPLCSANTRKKRSLLKYILPTIASIMILLACLSCFMLYIRKKKKKKKKPSTHQEEESPCLNYHRWISYIELVRATDNFNEANLLGTGSIGRVYKGNLDDALPVAVKVLNLEVEGASKSFDAECHTLGQVRHRNLVKIITTCSNMEFKALVLEFMPNGNLDSWLYSESRHLTLLQRINIMVDVSTALEYLHHRQAHVIVHCDLKPSNILLDEDMVAHVSDFGIAKLILGDTKYLVSANSIGIIGYIAPEYGSAGEITRRGDVYSFGVLLLELCTGKKPIDNMFSDGSNLRKWVCDAHPAGLLEIADRDILKEDSANMLHSDGASILHRCLSSITELGLICSKDAPMERILMEDVVPRLQEIRKEYLSGLKPYNVVISGV